MLIADTTRLGLGGHRLICTLAVIASTSIGSRLDAQCLPVERLPAGRRVRVQMTDRPPGSVTGLIASADSTSLEIARDGSGLTYRVRLEQATRIDVSRERRTRLQAFGRGARVGALVTGALGLVATAGAVYYDLHSDQESFVPATLVIGVASIGLTAGGTLLGGVIGLGNRDRWERVWMVPDRPRRSAVP